MSTRGVARLSSGLAAGLVAVLLPAAPADARPQSVGRPDAVRQLELDGPGVLWMDQSGGLLSLRRGAAGRRPQLLAHPAFEREVDPFDGGSSERLAALAVSSRWAVWTVQPYSFDGNRYDPAAGTTLGPPLTTVKDLVGGGLRRADNPCGPIDVDGDRLAVVVCSGPPADPDGPGPLPAASPRALEVRDLARPGVVSAAVPVGALRDVRIAGEMLAWRTDDAVVVHDLRPGADAVQLALPAGERVVTWDLQADGTVALAMGPAAVTGLGRADAILWAAPGATTLTRVAPRGPFAGLRLGGGRVAYDADAADGLRDLVLRDLRSGAEQLVAHTFEPWDGETRPFPGFAFDVDEERVAWVATTCQGFRILVEPVAGAVPVDETRQPCPARVGDAARVDPLGRATVPVTCPVLVPRTRRLACVVRARLEAGGVVLRHTTARVPAGRTGRLVFGAAPRLRRPVRGGLRVTATSTTAAGSATSTRLVRLQRTRP